MCTVTIVPMSEPGGWRLACNRDEQRRRPPARPPILRAYGRRQAIVPIDPLGRGTWITVNDKGVAFALLNVNPAQVESSTGSGDYTPWSSRPLKTRGALIPAIAAADSVVRATRMAGDYMVKDFAPFRIVIVDDQHMGQCVSDGYRLEIDVQPRAERPVMFTSSGLGDTLVEAPRRALFEQHFGDDPALWVQQQESFHRHQWADRPQLSVCMSRADAMTVSFTVVEVTEGMVRLMYQGSAPNEVSPRTTHELPRQRVPAA
jgi:hypothetical protein